MAKSFLIYGKELKEFNVTDIYHIYFVLNI